MGFGAQHPRERQTIHCVDPPTSTNDTANATHFFGGMLSLKMISLLRTKGYEEALTESPVAARLEITFSSQDKSTVSTLVVLSFAVSYALGLQATANSNIPSNVSIQPGEVPLSLFFRTATRENIDYRLGREDVIEIRVFELDQLNRTVRISGDGSIELPLVGRLPASGMTAEELAEEVASHLRDRYVQNPQVSIFILEFNSRKVSLLGAVQAPASYALLGQRRTALSSKLRLSISRRSSSQRSTRTVSSSQNGSSRVSRPRFAGFPPMGDFI